MSLDLKFINGMLSSRMNRIHTTIKLNKKVCHLMGSNFKHLHTSNKISARNKWSFISRWT